MEDNNKPKLSLQLKSIKKSSKKSSSAAVKEAFGDHEAPAKQKESPDHDNKTPIVIPKQANELRWKPTSAAAESLSAEDVQAAQALEQQADPNTSTKTFAQKDNKLVIPTTQQQQQEHDETRQYKADLEKLPDELPLDSEQYQKVPIAEFGAALLRGMGWKEDGKSKKDEESTVMPRPSRLGLGATPKLEQFNDKLVSGRKRRVKPDEFRKQKALEKQKEEYQRERERKLALDKQRTLQNGSLVKIRGRKRARILQLVGVPGLNMVKIQYENDTEASVIKRGDMEGLLSREELEEYPFQEASQQKSDRVSVEKGSEQQKSKARQSSSEREGSSRQKRSRDDSKRRRDDSERLDKSSSKRSRDEKPHWMIPNIRVRVITEKLGRRYYKEKGVVVDVTPKGGTLQMSNGTVLDRVPERYLETALPKPGGHAVVLAGKERHTKGRLLERNSRDATGVIQFFEDMNVMTLPLDNMAEWCGPLDDGLHE